MVIITITSNGNGNGQQVAAILQRTVEPTNSQTLIVILSYILSYIYIVIYIVIHIVIHIVIYIVIYFAIYIVIYIVILPYCNGPLSWQLVEPFHNGELSQFPQSQPLAISTSTHRCNPTRSALLRY